MKTITILLSAFVLLLSLTANAQQQNTPANDEKVCCEKVIFPNNTVQNDGVKKGYYAIGNNALKLANHNNPACCTENRTVNSENIPNKGFYSIGENSRKQRTKGVNISSGNAFKGVSKGYYAISNNAAKSDVEKTAGN